MTPSILSFSLFVLACSTIFLVYVIRERPVHERVPTQPRYHAKAPKVVLWSTVLLILPLIGYMVFETFRLSFRTHQAVQASQAARREAHDALRKADESQDLALRFQAELNSVRAQHSDFQKRANSERDRVLAILATFTEVRNRIVRLGEDFILFDTGDANLRSKNQDVTIRNYEVAAKVAGVFLASHLDLYRLKIYGHTDTRGDEKYNLILSEKRANAVKEYLLHSGIPDKNIVKVEGLGESQPLNPANTLAAHQRNRRVEIVVEATQGTN